MPNTDNPICWLKNRILFWFTLAVCGKKMGIKLIIYKILIQLNMHNQDNWDLNLCCRLENTLLFPKILITKGLKFFIKALVLRFMSWATFCSLLVAPWNFLLRNKASSSRADSPFTARIRYPSSSLFKKV